MGVQGRPERATRTGLTGFTLFELVLTVSLILLLAAGVIFGWDSLQRGARLEEGADQVEMLLRFARAHAATSGRLVRIQVGTPEPFPGTPAGTNSPSASTPMEVSGGFQVLWEPDPLKQPGTFEPLPGTDGFRERIDELVEVQSPEMVSPQRMTILPETPFEEPGGGTNAVAGDPAVSTTSSPGARLHLQITFYPDGSSDSVEWILSSKDPEDARRLRIRLSGLTGTTRRQWLERLDVTGMTNTESPATISESSASGELLQKPTP